MLIIYKNSERHCSVLIYPALLEHLWVSHVIEYSLTVYEIFIESLTYSLRCECGHRSWSWVIKVVHATLQLSELEHWMCMHTWGYISYCNSSTFGLWSVFNITASWNSSSRYRKIYIYRILLRIVLEGCARAATINRMSLCHSLNMIWHRLGLCRYF